MYLTNVASFEPKGRLSTTVQPRRPSSNRYAYFAELDFTETTYKYSVLVLFTLGQREKPSPEAAIS